MKIGRGIDLINFITENKLEDAVICREWEEKDKIWIPIRIDEDTSINYVYYPSIAKTEISLFKTVGDFDLSNPNCIRIKRLGKKRALKLRGIES